MTAREHDQIARLIAANEEAAAELPVDSKWRARFLSDADCLRTALMLPIAGEARSTPSAAAMPARLRLASVGGEILA